METTITQNPIAGLFFFTFFSKTSRAILPTEFYQLATYPPWKKCKPQYRAVQAEKAAAIK